MNGRRYSSNRVDHALSSKRPKIPTKSRTGKVSFKRLYEAGHSEVSTLGEPSSKCDYYVRYSTPKSSKKASAEITPLGWGPEFAHEDRYLPSSTPRRMYTKTLKIPHDPSKE